MKKSIICILTLLAVILLFGSALAGPEQVHIIPVSKWYHQNVDGWGFYAKGGEYSTFAFLLDNPSGTDYTVTLPQKVNIAKATDHPIVNTAYRVMLNGNNNFLYEAYPKNYFNNSFTLPKNSTYGVLFDITEIKRYNQQWDTDVFFDIKVSDQNTESKISLKGVLLYDARNMTPATLTIVNPNTGSDTTAPSNPVIVVTPAPGDKGGLVSVSFCRDYNAKNRKVSFSYTLKNTSSVTIPVELATSLAVEGFSKIVPLSYTGCTSGGSSCMNRISKGIFDLNSGESAEFKGQATLPSKPSKSNFYIRTSLRYDFGGRKLIPFLVGYASNSCSGNPVPPETEGDTGLVNVSFCRNYDAKTRKVTFSYALRNKSSETIPVELATTLAVQGFNKVVKINYTGCTSGGSSCANRISRGIFKLKAGETAEFRGEATLPSKPADNNFFIKTSLRYDYKGRTLIPFLVGYTTGTCTAAHTVSADEIIQKSSESGDLLKFSVRIINDRDTEMTVLPGAVLRGDAAFAGYKGVAAVSAVDVEISGSQEVAFVNEEAFILPPHSIAEITISLDADPAMVDPSDEILVWNYSSGGKVESYELNETQSKGLTLSNPETTNSGKPFQLIRIDTPQRTPVPETIPNFDPKP